MSMHLARAPYIFIHAKSEMKMIIFMLSRHTLLIKPSSVNEVGWHAQFNL